jgi:hypothetical protein
MLALTTTIRTRVAANQHSVDLVLRLGDRRIPSSSSLPFIVDATPLICLVVSSLIGGVDHPAGTPTTTLSLFDQCICNIFCMFGYKYDVNRLTIMNYVAAEE